MAARKKCSFASTGANYSHQEWFECKTCGFSDGSGVCGVCAQTCHKGHALSLPKNSRFYCDCGSSGKCQSMGGAAPPPASQKPQGRVAVARPTATTAIASSVEPVHLNLVAPQPYSPEDLPVDRSSTIIRLPPNYFVHILDTNTSITTVIKGPDTVTRLDHQTLALGPRKMVMIPPFHYVVIADPVVRGDDGAPKLEKGLYKNRFGDRKVEQSQEPFVLYPNEKVVVGVTPLQIVPDQTALRLRASRDFTDFDGVSRHAGEEWLFRGPRTYIPLVEAEIVEAVESVILLENQALRLRARNATTDSNGKPRKAGEEWLWRVHGAYLPGVDEQVVGLVQATILTENKAIHLLATRAFDDNGVTRKAGSEWLVKYEDATVYIPDVHEKVVAIVDCIVVNNRQWCVVVNPVDAQGVPQLGRRELRRGPDTFFLQPGEELESGIQDVYVLSDQEALLLKASEAFKDSTEGGEPVTRAPGDRWLVHGPREYVPPVAVQIVDRRRKIALDENEGIYVRDTRSGAVRSVIGTSCVIKADEELWAKDIQPGVAALLQEERKDPTRVVTYRVPHNAAMQIYDYRQKAARVVFGPELVSLEPDEQFTQLTLSGGKPKRAGEIRALVLLLGPDYMTDILTVETADHARLNLKLSYAWRFDVDKTKPEEAKKLFQVPDFVGDCCKAIASRVRGKVASVPFDMFHKHSANIINEAVFGPEETELRFNVNGLVVNAVDIQSVEPVDQRTRDALMKSVQMAIEITTQSQEAFAMHSAQRTEQEAIGQLARQKIEDEAAAERARRELLDLKAQSAAVLSTGQAKAEAKARAEASQIEGESAVKLAKLRADAASIESSQEIVRMSAYQTAELDHQTQLNEIEIERARELAEIETRKFKSTVDAIGRETIMSIARAGPEMQAKLLAGLGLQGFLVTDGNSPINLFNTANGLIGGGMA